MDGPGVGIVSGASGVLAADYTDRIRAIRGYFLGSLSSSCEARNHGKEFGRLDRFGDVHLKSSGERFHAVFDSSEGCQRNRGQQFLAGSADTPDQFIAVDIGHSYIGDEDIRAE